jgi:hypothetical protein
MAEGDFSLLPNETEQRLASRIAYGEAEIVHTYDFEGALVEFEQRFWDSLGLEHTWSAQVDRHDWQPQERRLLVIDDKTGWTVPPPVETNWQIRSETALLAEIYDAREAVAALIHPHHPDSLWQAHIYTRAECDTLLEIVRHNVAAIQVEDRPRIPGAIQCQYCTAKRVCPEYLAHEAALDRAIADEIQDAGFTAINRRTAKERGAHVQQLKTRVRNIELLLAQYTDLLTRDLGAIDGWRLSRKLTRAVTNEARAIELVRDAHGPDVLAECLSFSIKSLEDILAKRGTRQEAKSAVERLLSPILTYNRGKYYLTEARSL